MEAASTALIINYTSGSNLMHQLQVMALTYYGHQRIQVGLMKAESVSLDILFTSSHLQQTNPFTLDIVINNNYYLFWKVHKSSEILTANNSNCIK